MIDKHSSEWLEIRRWVEQQIEASRDRLEQPGDVIEFERGRIAALRDLLRLVDPPFSPRPSASWTD